MIGTSAKAKIETTADILARSVGSSMARRSIR